LELRPCVVIAFAFINLKIFFAAESLAAGFADPFYSTNLKIIN